MLSADRLAAEEPEASFPGIPTEVRAGGDGADLFDDVLPDVAHVHRAIPRVPGEPLGVAHPVGIDLRQRPRGGPERIRGGNAIGTVATVGTEGIDAKDLAEGGSQVLGEPHRIATAAAIGDTDVEQPEIRTAGPGGGVERERTPVVVGERLPPPEQHARGITVVGGGTRGAGPPLEQDGVMGRAGTRGREIRVSGPEGDVGVGVEPAEPRRTCPGELRMQRNALESALAALGVHWDSPARVPQIEIERRRAPIGAEHVEQAVHVAHEESPAGGLIDQGHGAGGDAGDVGKGRELTDRDGKDTLVRHDRLGERLVRLPSRKRRGALPGGDGRKPADQDGGGDGTKNHGRGRHMGLLAAGQCATVRARRSSGFES